ncbi:hypothetical protein ES708_24104 [subsurface metagenome]
MVIKSVNGVLIEEEVVVVVKPDDQIVNNSEVLVNDEDLVIPVGANDVWFVVIMLKAMSASVNPDMNYVFAVPAGGAMGLLDSAKFVSNSVYVPIDGLVAITLPNYVDERNMCLFGIYTGGGTAGNLQLQWAQNTATAEDTTMKAKSSMICFKVS